jgi:manganese oxidase
VGDNGVCPGPTIEVNEGDRVRIIFRNNLPEPTSVHWHGLELPIPMDGVPAISQPLIQPGQTFTYEFTLHQNGTFFYHSHMPMQEMMGQIGFFIIHPSTPHQPKVDKDFGIILQEWAILPNNTVPNSLSMEFNWLTFNGKAGPDSTPMIVRLGDRVRIRFVNLGMDHHPMHLHGNQFFVTGTEGGRIPQTAWYPGNTVLVGVAQARDIEFDAKRAGDWMLHCHLPHHMMNQMTSMVGPLAHIGSGMHTGMGMEEGMGIVRNSGATSEELGPSLGRGTGLAAHETPDGHEEDATGPGPAAQTHSRISAGHVHDYGRGGRQAGDLRVSRGVDGRDDGNDDGGAGSAPGHV